MKHKFHDCKSGHPNGCPDDDQGRDCLYDTLSVCSVCNLAEGELTQDCPGERVNYEAKMAELELPPVGRERPDDAGWPEYTAARGWFVGRLCDCPTVATAEHPDGCLVRHAPPCYRALEA